MRINYTLLPILLITLSTNFTACSKNNDENSLITKKKEIPELSLKDNFITLKVKNQTIIDIVQGGGDYKAFTLNEKIATVELIEDKLTVTAHSNGKTDLVISDGNNQYRKLAVNAYTYDAITLSRKNVYISFKHGEKPELTKAKVTEGNGNYAATSDNEEIATVAIEQSEIIITPTGKEGDAVITVTDFMGLAATLPVKVEKTINPFSPSVLNQIMRDATLRYDYSNGETCKGNKLNQYNPFNKIEDGINKFGYEFIDEVYDEETGEYIEVPVALLTLTFVGDRTVGKKQNGKISYKSQEYNDVFTDVSTNIEIIKNDSKKIWGVFYFVNGETIFYGHFCQSANYK